MKDLNPATEKVLVAIIGIFIIILYVLSIMISVGKIKVRQERVMLQNSPAHYSEWKDLTNIPPKYWGQTDYPDPGDEE